ncbi:unnamed protein product, partial [Ixodes hexagonus]
MADKTEASLDGKPLSSLRVVDLKSALEKRGLSKAGSKKELAERLKLPRLPGCPLPRDPSNPLFGVEAPNQSLRCPRRRRTCRPGRCKQTRGAPDASRRSVTATGSPVGAAQVNGALCAVVDFCSWPALVAISTQARDSLHSPRLLGRGALSALAQPPSVLQLKLEKLQQESAEAKDQVPNLALQDELGGQNDFVRQYLAAQQQTFAMQLKERRLTELQGSGSTPEAPPPPGAAKAVPRLQGPAHKLRLPVAEPKRERAKRESWERKRGRQCPSSIDPGGLLESPTRGEPPLEADAPTEARRTRLSTRQGDPKSEPKTECANEAKIERTSDTKIGHDAELESELKGGIQIRVKLESKRKPKSKARADSTGDEASNEPRQLRRARRLSPADDPPKKKQPVECGEPHATSRKRLPSERDEDAWKRLQGGPAEECGAVGTVDRAVRSPRKAAMAPMVLLQPLTEQQTSRYPSRRRRQSSSDESAKNLPVEVSSSGAGDDTSKPSESKSLAKSGKAAAQPSLDAPEIHSRETRPRSKRKNPEAYKGASKATSSSREDVPPEGSRNDSRRHTL